MDFSMPSLLACFPELLILSMVSLILLIDVFLPERHRGVTYLLVQSTLIAAFLVTVLQYQLHSDLFLIFSGHYAVDRLAVLSKLFIFVFSFFGFAYARDYLSTRNMARSEYYILGLFAVLGMSVMASAYSFLTIFLGLELLSLPLYAMIAMEKESNNATEAAMKYFIVGSLATGLLLYGTSMLYGVTGSIQIDVIAQVLKSHQDPLSVLALVFVLCALIFKFGAVPFHMWVPDVYQGAAAPSTLFIASAPKVAVFAVMMRVLVQAMPSLHLTWQPILIVVAILSMSFGNILAIAQSNLKRMLAYSSIAHIGYTLLGILVGPDASDGYSAAMFYISTYVLTAAGAFAVIAILSRQGIELDKLEDFRGLNARNPWLAFMMLLLLFSMAGVPPTVGFIAKLGLLEALIEAHMVWLAVMALIFAMIGAYYYLRVVMLMYFEEPAEINLGSEVSLSRDSLIFISINGAAVLLLGLLPSFFVDLCWISA